jgi:hypothetical protein
MRSGVRDAAGGSQGQRRDRQSDRDRKPDPILFQQWFRSMGPRVYAAQIKRAGNGNQYLVLTESKRDDAGVEPRKTRVYLYGEDFAAFFSMMRALAGWMKEHPLDSQFLARRKAFWSRKADDDSGQKRRASSVEQGPAAPQVAKR